MARILTFKMVILLVFFAIVFYLISVHLLRGGFIGEDHEHPPTVILTTNIERNPFNSDEHLTKTTQSGPTRRRVLFFGYCRHFHDFDAQFAKYSIEQLPNSEFYTINLDELNLTQNIQQLNDYAINHYYLQPHIDKWQWTLWPTCGQYKNPIYLNQRNAIKASKIFYETSNDTLSSYSHTFNALYSNPPYIEYPNHNTIQNQWHHDVYWPYTSHSIPLSHPSRPFIVAMSGEVFWESDYGKGENIDFELMRSRAHPKTLAFTGHWLQSAKGFYRKSYNRNDRNLQLLENEYQTRSDEEWENIYKNKTDFCIMIVKSVYQRGQYFPDALGSVYSLQSVYTGSHHRS